MSFDLLCHPMAFAKPGRIVEPTGWIEHVPFGFAIVQCHRPRLLVELGTHSGISYSGFCQAVDSLFLPTKCYAVDTWEGDPHAGFYGEEVFQEFSEYHDQHYRKFSSLMRMTFDEAASYFCEGTIDLLHVDGCHYYESVKHDFETWLPKMSERGVVLFHDTCAMERDFGVGRFFEEVRSRYPVFEFTHSYGLGVAAVGRRILEEPLGQLFQLNDEEIQSVRLFFHSLGSRITLERGFQAVERRFQAELAEREAQIHILQDQQRAIEDSFSWRLIKALRQLGHRLVK